MTAKEGFPQEFPEQPGINPEDVQDITKLIPPQVFSWLKGDAGADMPQEVRKLGGDVIQKINWFIVSAILGQYSRLPAMFAYLQAAEKKVYDLADFDTGSQTKKEDIIKNAAKITEDLESILEFSRKFSIQNKEVLGGSDLNPDDRILLDRLKALPPSTIKKVLELLDTAEQSAQ